MFILGTLKCDVGQHWRGQTCARWTTPSCGLVSIQHVDRTGTSPTRSRSANHSVRAIENKTIRLRVKQLACSYEATRRQVPENCRLHTLRYEDLTSLETTVEQLSNYRLLKVSLRNWAVFAAPQQTLVKQTEQAIHGVYGLMWESVKVTR